MPAQLFNFPTNNYSNQYNQQGGQGGYNQQGGYNPMSASSIPMYTILAPSDAALLTVKDDVVKFNGSTIDTVS